MFLTCSGHGLFFIYRDSKSGQVADTDRETLGLDVLVVEAETCRMEMLKSKITSKVPWIQTAEVSNTMLSSLEVSNKMAKKLACD